MLWAICPAATGGRDGPRRSTARLIILLALGVAAALLSSGSPAAAFFDFGFYRYHSAEPIFARPRRKALPRRTHKPAVKEEQPAAIPKGPVQVVVSIADQRVAVYANGALFAQSAVSTGKKGHSTPTGVFSVLEKRRFHRSNLYSNAPMPYMQRLTWSGIALHAGELPGYPASHGCIRLPDEFARLLWTVTRPGARVIIAAQEIVPVEISHPRLASLQKIAPPLALELRGPADEGDGMIRTAAAAVSAPASDGPNTATVRPAEQIVVVPSQKAADPRPITILVSRKTGKLQVRQGFKPLFEAAVSVKATEQPWGTHVYTALQPAEADGGLRWIALSMPSERPRLSTQDQTSAKKPERRARSSAVPEPAPTSEPDPAPRPDTALEQFDIAPDVLRRLADMVGPGATLIVSDNGASQETGLGTDFVVLTR
jgi:hypothetical protein